MELSLGFSPCPNDTFIFDALIHQKIDTEGLSFAVSFHDVETLNQKAFQAELDITKLSFSAFAHVVDQYALLNSGSALGFGVGPLLVCKQEKLEQVLQNLDQHSASLRVGIPGKYTTANFLLDMAYPGLHKQEFVFSALEQAVLDDEIDIALIIHENRFTYAEKGLAKIKDLGDYWEKETGCAIPLGGIMVNRRLPITVQQTVDRLIRRSVEYAFANPQSGLAFIRQHAQEMNDEVLYKHIDLYVNAFSVDLGATGKDAVNKLFGMAIARRIIPEPTSSLFIPGT